MASVTLINCLRARLDMRDPSIDEMNESELRVYAESFLKENTSADGRDIKDAVAEVIGLGPIERLLADDTVSEIMVNSFEHIYIERAGKLERAFEQFSNEAALRRAIDKIVLPLGRHIDEASPMVDARLPDGSRVNAVLAPLATKGSCLTIRKFTNKSLTIEDLVSGKSLTQQAADFLKFAVRCRQNIIVSGGTGTGKTTLLNVLSQEISEEERILTIEDAAELRLHHDNLISLEARPKNQEGVGAISIRELVINALRMRPDRLVVGECRGPEALDMLQAMNTGHAGSLSTVHANSARDALRRLEIMVLMGGIELPVSALRQQIASAVDLVVQIARLPDGRRAVISINEVTGVDDDVLQMSALFEYSSSQKSLVSNQVLCKFAEDQREDIREDIWRTIMEAGSCSPSL
ncbi:CpaF family protein [Idiomarina abyssalis]|uniref:CpaF family protein n=1 Tax=Idiomarina abyssalis TaxID=86102 RepID=A0A8I1GAG9_9GAMM|nr:CpaF family protein [Idiomarina abyssalis]MBJ7267374.1 CpaF family protein [Idiomarina abyssalis]MBJ7273363.1 CpaF family protein [Idiomarina abyssalis]MBJ7315117.1 CpaF family protein [Idiomarina abyssalis]